MSLLSNYSIFKGLESHVKVLETLIDHMKEEIFQMRDLIIDEKQPDTRLYFLLSGQVVIQKIDSNGKIVIIGKTDASQYPFFGESTLLGRFQKSANVVAHSVCRCLSLSTRDFDAFFAGYPAAVAVIYKNLATLLFDRVSKSNQDLLILGLMLKK